MKHIIDGIIVITESNVNTEKVKETFSMMMNIVKAYYHDNDVDRFGYQLAASATRMHIDTTMDAKDWLRYQLRR